MGKINVETCEIEGLKIITPAVYGDAAFPKYSFRTISLRALRVFSEDFTSRSIFPRTSLSGWLPEKFSTSLST